MSAAALHDVPPSSTRRCDPAAVVQSSGRSRHVDRREERQMSTRNMADGSAEWGLQSLRLWDQGHGDRPVTGSL